LQKHLADCGLGSRRFCEKLITAGRVTIDNQVVTELGTKVDPAKQKVACDGKPVVKEPPVTLLLNKPTKVICTSTDPRGRTTVLDLLENLPERVYTIGRLDYMSEGLILVTNDGELAHALMHPRHHVEKIYKVWVDSPLDDAQLANIRRGIHDKGELLRVLDIAKDRRQHKGTCYTITLGEGRNRQIRRMMERCGKKVTRLMRISIGPIQLGDLKPGAWRPAKSSELEVLHTAIEKKKSSNNV